MSGRCGPSQVACFDKATALFCLDGKFSEMSCGGPAGCVQSGKQVDCDNTIAQFLRLGWIEQRERRYFIKDRVQLERRAR